MPASDRVKLLERGEALAAFAAGVSEARAGDGRTLLVEGPAGIGKTTLLEGVRELCADGGLGEISAVGSEMEAGTPWAVIRELLGPRLDSLPPAKLEGAAALALPILRPTEAGSAPADANAAEAGALHGLLWLTTALTEAQPLALLIDDAQWCDVPSLRFLLYLAQRSADLRLLLVLASRPAAEVRDSQPLLERLAATARVLRPQPLSRSGVSGLIEQRLGIDPDPAFAAACLERTGGNPFLVRGVADAVRDDGLRPDADTAGELDRIGPEAISRSVLLRFARLPEDAQRLARTVAVLETGTLQSAATVAGLERATAAAAADLLVEQDLLAAGLPLRFAHPIVRAAVADALGPAERARLHEAAAGALAGEIPTTQLAAHLQEAEPRSDSERIVVLRRAAAEVLEAGMPAVAARHLRRALLECPSRERDRLVLAELAEAEALAGEEGAIDHLDEALAATEGAEERAQLRLRLGWLLCRAGRLVEGCDVLAAAIAEADDINEEIRSELEAAYLANAWQTAEHAADVRRRQADLLADSAGLPNRPLLAQSAMARLFAAEQRGELIESCRRLLASGALEEETADSLTFWIAIGCLAWSDCLDEVEEEIERAFIDARRRRSPVAIAWAYYARSWPSLWRGRLDRAAADASAAVEAWSGGWGMYLPAAKYWLARAQLELGDLDGARGALELANEPAWRETIMHPLWSLGRAELLTAEGRHAEATEVAIEVGERLAQFRIDNPTIFPWRSVAARGLARLDERAESIRLADEEVAVAERFGAPRALGAALAAAGIAHRGPDGVALLQRSVKLLEGSPARLELARATVDLGFVQWRAGERDAARGSLRAGLELARGLGARTLAARAEAELQHTGARPRREALSGPGSLTPAERRVAEMAAGGLTNRRIAEELFVSLRTVETHLTHTYTKLGIGERGELVEALGERAER